MGIVDNDCLECRNRSVSVITGIEVQDMFFGHLGRIVFERQIQAMHFDRLLPSVAIVGAAVVLLVAVGMTAT